MKIDTTLLFRFFSKKNTPEEADAIAQWLKSDEANVKEFENAYKQFALSTLAIGKSSVAGANVRGIKPHHSKAWILTCVSAAAALVLGVFVSVYNHRESVIEETTLSSEAKYGSMLTQTLTDGTVVELNSGSKVSYPAVFVGKERRVSLDGEAVFNVKHDTGKPFFVETFAYDIRVTGTRFDVTADRDRREFSATLLEGSVDILDKSREVVASLKPNQKISLAPDGMLRTENLEDASSEILWTQDQISLAGMSFGEMMDALEKAFGVTIVIDMASYPDYELPYCKVRISEGVIAALNVLQHHYDFSYDFDSQNNTYRIK